MAYLNLDMVGAGQGLLCEISQTYGDLFATMTESRQELSVSLNVVDPSGDSDHASFEDRGVPSLMLIYWPDSVYHTSRDVPERVSKEHLIETAKLTTLMALKLSQATITGLAITAVVATTASTIFPASVFPIGITGIIVVLMFAGVVAVIHFRKRNK